MSYFRTTKKIQGIRGEEWIYIAADEDRTAALALTVYTDLYPQTIPASSYLAGPIEDRRYGADVSLHVGVDNDDCGCEYVAKRACHIGGTSALTAEQLFREHGDPTQFHPQPEALWQALEGLHDKWCAEYRQEQAAWRFVTAKERG